MAMNKQEAIENVAKKTGLTSAQVKVCLDALLSLIADTLASNERVFFRGSFSLTPYVAKGRMTRSIQDGSQLWIPTRKRVRLCLGKQLLDRLNS